MYLPAPALLSESSLSTNWPIAVTVIQLMADSYYALYIYYTLTFHCCLIVLPCELCCLEYDTSAINFVLIIEYRIGAYNCRRSWEMEGRQHCLEYLYNLGHRYTLLFITLLFIRHNNLTFKQFTAYNKRFTVRFLTVRFRVHTKMTVIPNGHRSMTVVPETGLLEATVSAPSLPLATVSEISRSLLLNKTLSPCTPNTKPCMAK